MRIFSSGRSASTRSRLFGAVLITMTLLLNVGCSSASSDQHPASATTSGSGTLITASIKAGNNPFETAGIEDARAFLDVFNQVKVAIASDNKAEVASHILYPLRVNGASGTQLFQTRGDFVKHYDDIITKPVKQAIARQTPDQLFVNYQGVMVGNGEMWFGGSADSPQVIGMIAVNHDIDRY